MKRIGLMGGTFDPIHYGHLVTAEAACSHFDLDKVIFVPSGAPPHKSEQKVSPAVDRYLMTVMATVTNPLFEVSSFEMDKEGLSYTIDTVRHFKSIMGDCEIYFITGADAIFEIYGWKDSKELLKMCDFIAATRPGYKFFGVDQVFKEDIDKLHFFEVPALSISSTDIRKRVKENRPIKYLLPDSVATFINKAKLY